MAVPELSSEMAIEVAGPRLGPSRVQGPRYLRETTTEPEGLNDLKKGSSLYTILGL